MHNTNIPCGCLIEYEGDQFHQDYSIDWCPLHKAASELLEACQTLIPWLKEWKVDGTLRTNLEAAIAKATP